MLETEVNLVWESDTQECPWMSVATYRRLISQTPQEAPVEQLDFSETKPSSLFPHTRFW